MGLPPFPALRFWSKQRPRVGLQPLRRPKDAHQRALFLCLEQPQIPPSDMPKRTDLSSILIIGAGPIIIGQACEFD